MAGVPNTGKSHNHQGILAFSVAMREPLPCVKDCRPCGGLGAILLQEGLEAGCLGPLLKMHTSLCVPRASHIPLDTSVAPDPDSRTAQAHPCKVS